MKTSVSIVAGFCMFVLAGCASSHASQPPATSTPATTQAQTPHEHGACHCEMAGEMAGMCPMAVEGTTARAEEVEGGAAIVFTTSGDVSELRRRVAHMAEMHNQHHAAGHGPGMCMQGTTQEGGAGELPSGARDACPCGCGMHGAMHGGGAMMPPSTARSEDAEGGARLVFTPGDPADLPALREHVRHHAEMMASGTCPMMPRTSPPSTGGERGETSAPPTPSVVGGGPDAHGCVHDGGYVWCEREHTCVRPWELARQRGFESSAANFDHYCAAP